ncbi:hypothetical protein [Nocardiopsis sp. YSL2]|uniref:hypothetical protein n=1 Tax=Nocardiopsis sp. YSL2 TaxID=2939492 RepID=UPI0026F46DFB|nr:hypothetical protein [Nocardiopsis sp. YSL2]
MDLTRWLLSRAVPCAFVVTAVGGTGARLAVERELRERGWRRAAAPGEADLLVVCGPDDPGLTDAVDRVWEQVPGPRARVRVAGADDAARLLDSARGRLLDVDRQRRQAAERDAAARERAARSDGDDGGHSDHGDDHGGGGHHGHGEMSLPGGIPMADRGPDRDGLTLDRLHVGLGPALGDWPAGLCLRLTLQGDVVQEAETAIVGGAFVTAAFWDAPAPAAALDSAQRFLDVAGWPAAAAAGRRWRDALLAGPEPDGSTRRGVLRWLRRVRRSRMLRWSTNGLGRITGPVPEPLRGDATDRWRRWLDDVEAAVGAHWAPGGAGRDGNADRSRAEAAGAALDLLPSLVTGQELAAVRLVVASLDPDTEALRAHVPRRSRG